MVRVSINLLTTIDNYINKCIISSDSLHLFSSTNTRGVITMNKRKIVMKGILTAVVLVGLMFSLIGTLIGLLDLCWVDEIDDLFCGP